MFSKLSEKKIVLALYTLSGLSLGLGFFLPIGWLCGLLGVFILLLALSRTKTLRMMVGGSYLAWTISLGFSVSIFWSVYPIEWIDLELGRLELVVVGMKWLITAMVLGSGGIVFGFLFWFSRRFFSSKIFTFFIPIVWVLAEITQSFVYSVFVLGPSSVVNIYNSVGYVGYLIGGHHVLLKIALLGGVYALSFSGVAIATVAWQYFNKLSFRKFARGSFFVIMLLILTTLPDTKDSYLPTAGLKVAVVETEFGGRNYYGDTDEWTYRLNLITQGIEAALGTEADYIILPEDSRFTRLVNDPDSAYRRFHFLNSTSKVILVDTSKVEVSSEESVVRAFVYDNLAKKMHLADKQYLTPLGEYFPYIYGFALRSVGLGDQVEKLNKSLSYRLGPLASQSSWPELVPRVLFCFEALNPSGVRDLLEGKEAPFIAHPISHAWFHDSALLNRHLDSMLKIQAVWNQIPIVSAGNMAESNLYTSAGKVIKLKSVAEGERWKVKVIEL